MFRSLRVRNYRLFASGQLVSLTGSWMQRVAQDWLVLTLTNSGTALGIEQAGAVVGEHDDRLPLVGRVCLTADQPLVLQAGQHLGHRRRLHPFQRGQLAGAHRSPLAQRAHGRELSERDGQVNALVAQDPGEAEQRRTKRRGKFGAGEAAGRCHVTT